MPAQNYFPPRVRREPQLEAENVLFAGNLIAVSNVAANAAQSFGGGFGGKFQTANTNVMPPLLFFNSRIAGTVTIDNTNRIEINAPPVNS